MSSILALALLVSQSDVAPPQPWHGTLAQGLDEVRRLSEADQADQALAVAERLLAPTAFARWRERATGTPGWRKSAVEAAGPLFDAVGLSDLRPQERAAIQFARGVVLARAEKRAESDEAFEKARALAGPGELRMDATYDLGWTALAEGEALRAKIPELNGGAAAPPAAPEPGNPDPLDLARAAYQTARDRFVEVLKATARDADARANVELAQRRLRELAEIQKKREEEKKKQEQQKKDESKNDPNKKDQDKKDQQKQDQDKQDPQKKDSSSEDKDKKKPDEPPKDDKKDEKKDEPKDQETDKDKQEKKAAQPQPAKEEQLTKEEIMRILDTLKDREEEGKKLLEQLRRARRAKVKRDW